MRFQKGDKVLAINNAPGMNFIVNWPIKAVIYTVVPTQHDTYNIIFDPGEDVKLRKELERQGLSMGMRWTYPGRLLKRDTYCPVCSKSIETYSDRRLISEHANNEKLCYGSHQPLDL